MKIARDDWRSTRTRDHRSKRNAPRGRGGARGQGAPQRQYVPSRYDVVDRLDSQGLLPAIIFIFSRVGCDAAVTQCLNANLGSPPRRSARRSGAFVENRCRNIPDEDLHVLGYHDFLDGLTRGVAAHHAGMLPTFKECVEELFTSGLCRVVFATETLALGINMPARSVVIEKLSKWNGETHADITPGEYTQLTGRAGRRGIDVEGHGVVLWQQGFDPKAVAGLASTRTYPLKSSFRPSYNMAVNLVHQFGRATARELLESSFAQFQADKAVVGLARQLRKAEDALAGYAEAADLPPRRLHGVLPPAPPALRRRGGARPGPSGPTTADQVVASLEALRPGDVIEVPAGKFAGMAVVIDPGMRVGPRRSPALRADRRPQRPPALDGRLPGARRGVHPDADPQDVQRPQPAVPARPRLDAARPDPGLHAPAPASGGRAADLRQAGPRQREGDRPAARASCGPTPATAARTGRTTPAGPSATTSSTGTRRRCSAGSSSAPTPSPASSTGSARCSRRSATSRTTR